MENGKGAVARGLRNRLGCGTTELHVIRPRGGISPDYLYRFLAQSTVRRAAKDHSTGTAGQARVPTAFIEELEVPLAPLPEQRRIVAKLETLLGKVDACKARLAKIPVLLKRFRQAVLAAACSGRLTEDWREENPGVEQAIALVEEIKTARGVAEGRPGSESRFVEILAESDQPDVAVPEGWIWVRFGSVLGELRNGVPLRPNMEPPGTPILRISAARPGSVDLSDVRYMPDGEEFLPLYSLRDDDLLFTRYNGSIELLGVCGLVRGLGARTVLYPDKLMRVRFDHRFVLPTYTEVFFQSAAVHERVVAKAKSSAGQNGVSGSDIKAQPFALPPLAEQQEIVRRVDALFAVADQLQARFERGRQQVEKLTPSILARAFRGELVPQDPEDEPAAKLLERVYAKRSS
jgi:type I restriction enzyme S subunit